MEIQNLGRQKKFETKARPESYSIGVKVSNRWDALPSTSEKSQHPVKQSSGSPTGQQLDSHIPSRYQAPKPDIQTRQAPQLDTQTRQAIRPGTQTRQASPLDTYTRQAPQQDTLDYQEKQPYTRLWQQHTRKRKHPRHSLEGVTHVIIGDSLLQGIYSDRMSTSDDDTVAVISIPGADFLRILF
jgi:hypothetical protein